MAKKQYKKEITIFTENPLTLSSGKTLGPITIAYETYGVLNQKKDNAILLCHALSGDAHVARHSADDDAGWWDFLVGPGKAIDTDRFFVICTNTIGSCYGSTGPLDVNPKTGVAYGLSFPVITIKDMVHAQHALIEQLGISRLKSVIGGSMGGMQVLEWAITYPDMLDSCIPIAISPALTPHALAFNSVGRESILTDPNWNNGQYTRATFPKSGLSIARMIGHITYRSSESFSGKFGRKLQKKTDYGYDFSTDFAIESYLKYQGDKFVNRFDPNSYLYLSRAMSYFDLDRTYGSLECALSPINARALILSISSDLLYPPSSCRQIADQLIRLQKHVTYAEINSPHGHDAFLMDTPDISNIVSSFLESSHA